MKTIVTYFIVATVAIFAASSAYAQIFTEIVTVPAFSAANNGPPVRDAIGNLYSASGYGGLQSCMQGEGCGFILKVDPTGKPTVIYRFQGQPDGATPLPGLVLDSAGNIYGTTESGGAFNFGTVFKVDVAGNETVLHSFSGPPNDGEQPFSGLIRDARGNLYGTTSEGGLGTCFGAGCGTVYRVSPVGKETVLYRFSGGADGAIPWASLLLAGGALYGTTADGGNLKCQAPGNAIAGCGTVFKLDNTGETVLYSFNDGVDGGFPVAGVVRDAAGNLYGGTEDGGDLSCNSGFGCGVAYKLDPSGNETVLHTFQGIQDGETVHAGLVLDQGNLYGSTLVGGGIFQIDMSGNFSVIYALNSNGTGPSTMIRDSEGNLYGTYGDEFFRFMP
ncbi:MAG TPA: choice-of-anchor tandem repeat GloVer-containing protein [Candidatus Dormibacteraeota bacterium]|nr:choice-of-anchor tandem repeat GloVer-containing protein [Candidatus Dormibacteraeota bacterium]